MLSKKKKKKIYTYKHIDIPRYLYNREHKFTLDLHLYKNLSGELSRLILHGHNKTNKKSKEKLMVQNLKTDILNLIYKLILSLLHVTHFSLDNFSPPLKNSFLLTSSL